MGNGHFSRRTIAFAAGIALAVICSIAPAAFAETYTTPTVGSSTLVSVGTNGSDTDYAWLAVSHGGCAGGNLAVAVGESNRACGHPSVCWPDPCTGDASGAVAIGLLGADAGGYVAVSDSGEARTCPYPAGLTTSGCLETPPVAVSGTGPADGHTAVSGTGNAHSSFGVAVSGTGTANSSPCSWDGTNAAVSIIGDANGCTAISVAGNANGEQTSLSVVGTVTDLLP